MKKTGFVVIVAALLLFVLCGCGKKEEYRYSISYVNKDNTKIVDIGYEEHSDNTKDLIDEFMEALQSDGEVVGVARAIPTGVTVNEVTLDDKQVSIDLGEGYDALDDISKVLMRAAVVRTLTQLDDVSYVSFYIEGKPLEDSNGNVVGLLSNDSFIENPGEQINSIQESTITLYFANSEGNGLVEEVENVYETSNISMEKLVMEHLLEGPKEDGLQSTIPEGTKLNSVSVLDGVCMVNLNEGFSVQNYEINEEIVIYSIVNSLTELSNINKVQISINGDTSKPYREKCMLETLYERNLDYVVSEDADSSTEGETNFSDN